MKLEGSLVSRGATMVIRAGLSVNKAKYCTYIPILPPANIVVRWSLRWAEEIIFRLIMWWEKEGNRPDEKSQPNNRL